MKEDQPVVEKKSGGNLSPEANEILQAAGNAASDRERLRLLQELQKRSDLPPDFREDLSKMIAYVERWTDGYELSKHSDKYLTLPMNPVAQGKEYAPRLTNNPVLRALVGFYMGRARIQGFIQTYQKHTVRTEAEKKAYEDELIGLFSRPREVLSKNPVVGMYAGYPIPWPTDQEIAPDPNAPEWANLQREGLEKLGQVLRWWIQERQKPEGFFGTGWNDDVELWRSFVPLTVAFYDPELVESQRKVSEAAFAQPHMAKGFSSITGKAGDAEHVVEDAMDAITPMLFLAPDDELWRKRTAFIVGLAKEKWSGINERGQFQFKSTYFNVDGVNTDPVQACDTTWHGRGMQAPVVLWQRGLSPATGEFILPWMKTWVDASMREENGKPAGVVPTTIHWPDGRVGGLTPQWWKPGNFPTPLYNWPNGQDILLNVMFSAYLMSDDVKYMEPIFAMARYRKEFLEGKLGDPSVEGSLAWSAKNMLSKSVFNALSKYRLVSGDAQYDELLKADTSGYVLMRLTGDRTKMVDDLLQHAKSFRVNFQVYTSECMAGDRLAVGPERYFGMSRMPQPMPKPNFTVLFETATGNPSMAIYGLINAVRWLTPAKEIAALVTDTGRKKFSAELYHFGAAPRPMEAELLGLDVGTYRVTLKEAKQGGKVLLDSNLQVTARVTRQKITLPSRELCFLSVEPIKG